MPDSIQSTSSRESQGVYDIESGVCRQAEPTEGTSVKVEVEAPPRSVRELVEGYESRSCAVPLLKAAVACTRTGILIAEGPPTAGAGFVVALLTGASCGIEAAEAISCLQGR